LKLKKQQLLGCDETICLKEIANALETEELMTYRILEKNQMHGLKQSIQRK
jgi:hypothetical protein